MWNQTKILKEKRSLSTIQTGEIKITNHWRERIKVQHKPVEVSFLACITVLSVFFLFASLLCPHLQQEAAADGSLSARWQNSAIWRTVWLWAFGLHPQHYNSTRLQPTTILSTTTTLLVSWVHEVQPDSQTCHKFICLVKVRYWILGSECGLCAIVRKKEGVLV